MVSAIWKQVQRMGADGETEHETEISFFNMKAYEEFKANPEEKW